MPSDIEIFLNDSLTPAQRELAEQSVYATVEHRRAAAAARARSIEEEEILRNTVSAPVAKLIQADRDAVAALGKLSNMQLEPESSLETEGPPSRARDDVIPGQRTYAEVVSRAPPYDFAWRWHDTAGAPPFEQRGDQDGRLGLIARSGNWIVGGADRFVSAHIGVGCIVRLPLPLHIRMFSPRSSRYSFIVGAHGISGNATSEGGLETTFMRGGTVLSAGTMPLWRKRVSANEEARNQTSFTDQVYPNGMGDTRDPGDYAFNVGIWTFADASSGIGRAGAESLVQSNILEMRFTLWS